MSVEKAKTFLETLVKDKELQEKFSGFTLDELKQAAGEIQKSGELSDSDLDDVAGGLFATLVLSIIT